MRKYYDNWDIKTSITIEARHFEKRNINVLISTLTNADYFRLTPNGNDNRVVLNLLSRSEYELLLSTQIRMAPTIRCENFKTTRKWNFEFKNIKTYRQCLGCNAVMKTGKYTDTI